MAGTLVSRPVASPCSSPVSRSVSDMRFYGGVAYLFRDEFTTAESAPIASPRTAEPGPGTLTAVQTDGEYDITAGGVLNYPAQTSAAWGDQYIRETTGLARTAGRLFVATLNIGSGTDLLLGWANTATVTTTTSFDISIYISTTILKFDPGAGTGQAQIGTYSTSTDYQLAFVQRATGGFVLIKGGAYSDWTLLWVEDAGTTATLYAALSNYGVAGTLDRDRVPETLWTPTPLASDSFDRADSTNLGNTDGAGVEESGGSGLAWEEFDGTAQIKSNRLEFLTSQSYAVCDAGEADVVVVSDLHTATGGSPGVVLRAEDVNNLWLIQAENVAERFGLYDRVGGTWTLRASASVTIADSTTYSVLAVADGSVITAYLNGANRISYGSATFQQTKTKHGAHPNIAGVYVDNFAVFPRTITDFPNV